MPSTDPCVLAASRSGKRLLWLEDTSISLYNASYYIDFQKARGRATARRRQLLVAAEKEGDTEALKKLALEECLQRRLIASEDGLEDLDEVRPLLTPSLPQPHGSRTPCANHRAVWSSPIPVGTKGGTGFRIFRASRTLGKS